jgi:hypothetical protein
VGLPGKSGVELEADKEGGGTMYNLKFRFANALL